MLTLKALHLIAMVSWFAGLFYLPRIFVYHVKGSKQNQVNKVFLTMERKLYSYIMTPAMLLTWVMGFMMIMKNPEITFSGGWIHAKLLLVIILTIYHFSLGKIRKEFVQGQNKRTEKFFRLYNEVPTIILMAVIFLAVLKPF